MFPGPFEIFPPVYMMHIDKMPSSLNTGHIDQYNYSIKPDRAKIQENFSKRLSRRRGFLIIALAAFSELTGESG
jgi:hypothetical protein